MVHGLFFESVRKTSRALVLYEPNFTGGIGAEIAALIAQECFEYLDAPVVRVASLDTPVPMNPEPERNFLANARLEEALMKLLEY